DRRRAPRPLPRLRAPAQGALPRRRQGARTHNALLALAPRVLQSLPAAAGRTVAGGVARAPADADAHGRRRAGSVAARAAAARSAPRTAPAAGGAVVVGRRRGRAGGTCGGAGDRDAAGGWRGCRGAGLQWLRSERWPNEVAWG